MTKRNSTKRALLASVLSTVLCLTMLVGSTFAWFTDSATTGVNTIQAGNLDVMLMMKTGVDSEGKDIWEDAEGKVLNFKKAGAASAEPVLFEPGATYELPTLRIDNNGSLALKFKLLVNGVSGDMELAELLRVRISVDGAQAYDAGTLYSLMTDEDGAAYGVLKAKETTEEYTIALHMPASAGNEYMNKKLENMAFTVIAAQLADEYDSYGNQYDKDALYPDVISAAYNSTSETRLNVDDELEITIPAGTVLTTDSGVVTSGETILLSMLEGSLPANLTIASNAESYTYEISLTTLDGKKITANSAINVELNVGKHTSGDVKLYHYENLVEGTKYNASTGIITFDTTSFSPFTVEKYYEEILYINNIEELKAFRDSVNEGKAYAKSLVKLNADIDLENEEWTSIGLTKDTAFAGAFDGNNHTVSNLYMSKSSRDDGYYAGLFAHSKMTEMKNLTIHNANVSGGNMSAVLIARQHTGIDISNISFTGDVYLQVSKVEGGLLVANGQVTSVTDVTVNVSDKSYAKCLTKSTDTWEYFGGVWGHVWPTTAKNIYSNIDVYGYASSIGGIGGACAVNSDNVVCEGDVIIAIDDTELYRGYDCSLRNGLIYGFGVGSSNAATHTNCSATGTLTVNGNVITSLESTDDHNTAEALWDKGYQKNDVRFGAPYYAGGVITVND